MNSLTNLSGATSKHIKEVLKEDPKNYEKVFYFSERCSHLDILTQNLHQSQQVRWASGSQDFQKAYVPMDFDLLQAKQFDFLHKTKKQ